jgi:predicted transcriptional regulator
LKTVAKEDSEVGLTRLMYASLVSFNQVKEYLKILKENNLLNHNTTNKKYTITANGLKFLELYEQMDAMLRFNEPL